MNIRKFLFLFVLLLLPILICCKKYTKITEQKIDIIITNLVEKSIISKDSIIFNESGRRLIKDGKGYVDRFDYCKKMIVKDDYLIELTCTCTNRDIFQKDYYYFVSIYKSVIFENNLPTYFSLDNSEINEIIEVICLETGSLVTTDIIKHYFDENYLITNFENNSYFNDDVRVSQYSINTYGEYISYSLFDYSKVDDANKTNYPLSIFNSKDGYLAISYYVGSSLEGWL